MLIAVYQIVRFFECLRCTFMALPRLVRDVCLTIRLTMYAVTTTIAYVRMSVTS